MKRLTFMVLILAGCVADVTNVVEKTTIVESKLLYATVEWTTVFDYPLGYRTSLKVGMQDWGLDSNLHWVHARLMFEQGDSGWTGGRPPWTIGVDHDSTLTSIAYWWELRRENSVLEAATGIHRIILP